MDILFVAADWMVRWVMFPLSLVILAYALVINPAIQ